MASVLAPSAAPPTQDGKQRLRSAPLRRGASALLALPDVSAPARSVVQKRGMTIVRKFGGSAVGLSVTGSSFAAPLPSLDEAVASGARVPRATELRSEPPVVALVDEAAAGHRPDAAPPPGSSWTTVDVGDRGLVDAVLDTLVHAHRRWGGRGTPTGRANPLATTQCRAMQRLRCSDVGGCPSCRNRRANVRYFIPWPRPWRCGRGHVSRPGRPPRCDGRCDRLTSPGWRRACCLWPLPCPAPRLAGNDGRVVLWDMAARSFVHSYADHDAAVTAVRICGDVVVSASQVRAFAWIAAHPPPRLLALPFPSAPYLAYSGRDDPRFVLCAPGVLGAGCGGHGSGCSHRGWYGP